MKKALYLLGQLEDSDLQWMLEIGESRKLSAGSVLIRERTALDELFLVIQGEFVVSVASQPDESIAVLGSGEIVGEMSLLDSRSTSATVTARADSVVFAIEQDLMRSKLETDAPFAARFYRALCIFMANRLNRAVLMIGKGAMPQLDDAIAEEDEISPEALEQLSLAGARFDWLVRQIEQRSL